MILTEVQATNQGIVPTQRPTPGLLRPEDWPAAPSIRQQATQEQKTNPPVRANEKSPSFGLSSFTRSFAE